ncbi:FadR family transcriptional regulator [Kribbella sp. NBC_01484]|uniref:FadR/GntR family transcriptional regulator n=1 Tax=Kribbella sp. NBC_01484 TaxID=2903579 RepID=UPI002E35FF91|nr:FadR/GntR family transcriptional regulator [Kribbella sp. NBC_01484]
MSEGQGTPFIRTRFRPVQRLSTASLVARQLIEQLGAEHIPVGARLPSERDLAQMLGVGRSTLREAIAALELLGLVDIRPGSGSYLRADSTQLLAQALEWSLALGEPEIGDLVEVREQLELLAARLATGRADEAQLERLREHVDRMRDAGDDVEAFVAADIAFHLEIATIAQNVVLHSLLTSIQSLLADWFDRTLRVPGTIEATLAEHQAVFTAIQQGDPDAAETAMATLMTAADHRVRRSR